jgi:integrase/recombinase XerD
LSSNETTSEDNMSEQAIATAQVARFVVPKMVAGLGDEGAKRFAEFFAVPIRNKNTREAYTRAVAQFLAWCQEHGFKSLEDVEPITVAAYIEQLTQRRSLASVKQHAAAIRMMFSWLVERGILPINPAREVVTARFSRTEGATPGLPPEEVQQLFDSIDTTTIVGLHDRAILAVLAYTFARVSAVLRVTPAVRSTFANS